MYNVIKGKVEASEFKVTASSEICSAPLMNLNLKKDVINPGDSVIIVTKILGLKDISDILLS